MALRALVPAAINDQSNLCIIPETAPTTVRLSDVAGATNADECGSQRQHAATNALVRLETAVSYCVYMPAFHIIACHKALEYDSNFYLRHHSSLLQASSSAFGHQKRQSRAAALWGLA